MDLIFLWLSQNPLSNQIYGFCPQVLPMCVFSYSKQQRKRKKMNRRIFVLIGKGIGVFILSQNAAMTFVLVSRDNHYVDRWSFIPQYKWFLTSHSSSVLFYSWGHSESLINAPQLSHSAECLYVQRGNNSLCQEAKTTFILVLYITRPG